jgi:predicted RNA-binding Zn ribbon-like protein
MTLPPWVPGDEHDWRPAPEPLLLVQAFVNTRDLELGSDLLAEAESGTGWLRLAGLLNGGAMAGPDDLRAARDVRECIRAMIAHNGGGPEPGDRDLGPLRALTRSSHPRLAVGRAGLVQIEPGPGGHVADGLIRLLVIIRDTQRDGTWSRLKACGNAECGWAFYDRSHSRRGAWCDMAACGNLIKNRNLRARRSGRAGQAPSAERDADQADRAGRGRRGGRPQARAAGPARAN